MSWSNGPNNGANDFTGTSGNDTADGLGGNDSLAGLGGNDTLIGDQGRDTLDGGDGNDSLWGGADRDTILGGVGDDTVLMDQNGDSLVGGDGTDVLNYDRSIVPITVNLTTGLSSSASFDTDTVSGFEVLLLGDGNDNAVGSTANETFVGFDGNDTLDGGAGDDSLDGGVGRDSLDGGAGNDTIDGGTGSDTIGGGGGNDSLIGGDGDDAMFGEADNDTLSGGGGNDELYGGSGADVIEGNDGNDFIDSEPGNDTVDGGAGNDTISGGTDDDSLLGGTGDDSLDGDLGNDTLDGGAGNDIIAGGEGNDLIRVGTDGAGGLDQIAAQGGTDTLDLAGWNGPSDLNSLVSGNTYGQWTYFNDGSGSVTFNNAGTSQAVLVTGIESVTCFAEGTRIATARGEVPVEHLRAGDLVLTTEGGAPLKPVRWVGRSRIDVARHPDRARVAPILIRADALADGVPVRDLRVSPEHAMFLDGVLVTARLLVNGTSIVQESWRAEVTYWHVELDAHGLLVSDGAVSESYFDDGNRHFFDNNAVTALVKDYASERQNGRYREAACAPVVDDGPALERIRLRIAVRAAAFGRARQAG